MSNYSSSQEPSLFKVYPIPCHSDNYAYAIVSNDDHLALVDPSEPAKVLTALESIGINISSPEQQKKTMVLTTHKHWDHSNGNKFFASEYPEIPILGGVNDNVPHANHLVKDGDAIRFGDHISIDVLETPCHTSGHVCYFLTATSPDTANVETNEHALFSGDTLFVAGCGRFFEGTPDQMFANMTRFKALPNQTLVYTGHEYTASNLRFAAQVDPSNLSIQHQMAWCEANPNANTHPSTIELEKQTNVFLRAADPKTLGLIRGMKDNNKPSPLSWSH